MRTAKLIPLPKKLADSFDTYYQTSAFARSHFTKFSRDFVTEKVIESAQRLGYEVTVGEGKNAGQFVLTRSTQTLRVTRANFPLAELRVH